MNIPSRIFASLSLALLACSSSGQDASTSTPDAAMPIADASDKDAGDKTAAIQRVIDDKVAAAMSPSTAVGLVVGVVDGADRVLAFYGEAVRGSGKKPTGTTLFGMGSNSKCFTATLLAWYATQGKTSLTEKLNGDLPAQYQFAPGSPKQQITFEELGSHTSGFPRIPSPQPTTKTYSVDQLYAYADSVTLSFAPGSSYDYSNIGFSLLGFALANKIGQPWEALVQQVVSGPLGMADTNIYAALDAAQLARTAGGYWSKTSAGCPAAPCPVDLSVILTTMPAPAINPAGGLFATGNDMMIWLAYNMGLSSNAGLTALLPMLRQERFRVSPSLSADLAWNTSPATIAGQTYDQIWKDGDTDGFHSYMGYVPSRGIGVFIMANFPIAPIPHDMGNAILGALP